MNCLIYICVFVKISEAHYTSQWAVHITGGHKVADQVARDHDFDNQGQVRYFEIMAFQLDIDNLAEADMTCGEIHQLLIDQIT